MNNEIGNIVDSIRWDVKQLHGITGPKAQVTYERIMRRLDWLKDAHGYAYR